MMSELGRKLARFREARAGAARKRADRVPQAIRHEGNAAPTGRLFGVEHDDRHNLVTVSRSLSISRSRDAAWQGLCAARRPGEVAPDVRAAITQPYLKSVVIQCCARSRSNPVCSDYPAVPQICSDPVLRSFP